MKKMIFALVAAFLVAGLSSIPTPVHADLAKLAQGDGAGSPQKDSVGGQSVQESYDKGVSWQLPVAFTALSGTSAGCALYISQVVGVSSAYVGAWKVRIWNTGPTTLEAINLTYTAYADASAPKGQPLVATTGYLEMGPMSYRDYAHARGLSATATGYLQFGTYSR